jgi:hypothetical protein
MNMKNTLAGIVQDNGQLAENYVNGLPEEERFEPNLAYILLSVYNSDIKLGHKYLLFPSFIL